ncbi:efflux transporter periplasmic adaptor subunit [Roseateles aquatilis]|uniref:Efflux transporter periplasmic adaptor subunit n=1 Tax=Roseateles aquatilis TaxID=431061 RepID=A0A246JH14_9BURK|nr:efflux RND transporter periplasmic adaptor subunit [Roseateles aquatilis]OWQ91891.1 efflux transporter periplasmic adaptor subunit [Roseateles aquatilis]
MKRATTVSVLIAAGALLAVGGFVIGRSSARGDGERAPTPSARASSAGDRQVLYWHDPMVPGPRFDKPGKSPFMDMQLVPVYAGDAAGGGDGGVRISPTVLQNLGVRAARVQRAEVGSTFDAVGTVQFNERLNVDVQTRVAGYVEHLAVRAAMERVRQGQPLATVFAPEWLGPQNEWLALRRAGAAADLVTAARERMRALSIPDELVGQSERTGTAMARFTLRAPIDGVVAELGVREGVQVTPGATLFRLAGLNKVWVTVDVPEAQAPRLERGQQVTAVLSADATRSFAGKLTEILPQVDAGTRSVRARFEVDNKGGGLIPGMLLRLQVAGAPRVRLTLPTEAVIRTGARTVVVVRGGEGGFAQREITLGIELGDRVEVLDGLREGDEVVVSGQFLIDSEARLKSALGGGATTPSAAPMTPTAPTTPAGPTAASVPASPAMTPMSTSTGSTGSMGSGGSAGSISSTGSAGSATSATQGLFHAEGTIEQIDADSVTISHGPVPALRWPAMTMSFGAGDAAARRGLKVGDRIRFEFRQSGESDWALVSTRKTGDAR